MYWRNQMSLFHYEQWSLFTDKYSSHVHGVEQISKYDVSDSFLVQLWSTLFISQFLDSEDFTNIVRQDRAGSLQANVKKSQVA
jgi:hypothetical protein